MEKFMYLFRGVDDPNQSPEVIQAHLHKWFLWIEALGKKGAYVSGEPLDRRGKQVNGAKRVVTDGPFIEAKEMVAGYLIVNAADMNEAVEISKDCPIFDIDGKLEIRQMQKTEICE